MKVNFKNLFILLLIIALVIVAVSFVSKGAGEKKKFGYSDVIKLFDDDVVVSYEVNGKSVLKIKALEFKLDENGNKIKDAQTGKFVYVTDSKTGNPIYRTYQYKISYSFQLAEINEIANKKLEDERLLGIETNLEDFNYAQIQQVSFLSYVPYIIVLVIFIVFFIFIMRSAPGGGGKMNNFSKSHARVLYNEKDAVKFADVAGADEEKAELEEVVEFLKDPTKYIKLGGRIPRGILLVGPPGTGKTLLAKAVAGEAGVPFFSISGSDFVEMYVGVGASRVRDLFDSARKTPASIVFIDEIDAVGRHRGAGLGGGHDEREQTLNQLLVEMDGFGTHSGVIVMAATNRPDILDPALLRPGRFDRRVTVNYPDSKGREEILKVHSRNKPLEATVDFKKIALTTIGFTGADLANLMNEAALRAAKKNKALIGMDDIEESYMKIILGPQKKRNMRRPEDNKLVAYHEAGHAVSSFYCKNTDPVKHITIIPAGNAGGVTISVPTVDKFGSTKNEMIDNIVMTMGGRVAEELVLDDISTGASQDIQQATTVARNMVTRYGMSDKLGTVLYGSEHSSDEVFLGRDFSSSKNYSEKTAADIDEEIRRIISEAYDTCKRILTVNIEKLHFIAEFLLKNESMDEEQFKYAMENLAPTIEEVENIATEKKRKSDEENKTAHENIAKAEEEARKKAEEEARLKAEMEKKAENGEFSSDDFFKTVFNSPADISSDNKKENGDSDSDSDDNH